MTIEMTWLTLFLVLSVWLYILALLWRQTIAIQAMSGIQMLKRDRERLDHLQMVQQLIEKLYDPDNVKLALQHGNERLHLRRLDAKERDDAMRADRSPVTPKQPDEDRFCEIADAVHV